MLTLFFGFNPFNVFVYGLTGVFLFLDGVMYWCVSKLFSLYVALAGAEIITSEMYNDIVQKFEVIIGVVMLFYLAYALLKSIINPENLEKNTTGIVKNFIVSIVLLTVIPVIFDYAFQFQNAIITENKIGVLLFGDEADSKGIENAGNRAAFTTLTAFLEVRETEIAATMTMDGAPVMWMDIKRMIIEENDSSKFFSITEWVKPVHSAENASYVPIISTICGGFFAYILVSFCLDLGVRVVKLAFYQIIAPVPIIMRIIPEKKSVFDNWLKATLSTYLEVFIRIFIMFVVVYLADLITDAFAEGQLQLNSSQGGVGTFGLVIVILGLFGFAKQAPKLIGDVIGIDAGSMKLGIKDKLANNYIGGKHLVGAMDRATGLATGFMGGALSAKMNGGSFFRGGLSGGVNGFKGKGNQFGKQRQAIYSMTGGKGKAGIFGGRAFFDNQFDKIQKNADKDMKNAYKANQQKNIDKFENSSKFQNYMQQHKNNQVADAQNALTEAQRKYDENKNIRANFENSAEYNGIMTRHYNQAEAEANAQMKQKMHEYSAPPGKVETLEEKQARRAKYQQDKQELINSLQRKYTYQELASNNSKGLSSDAGKQYINAISQSGELENQVKAAQANLTAVQNDNESSYEAAKKYFTKGDGNKTSAGSSYKSSVEFMDKEQQKADMKKYLESEEGQRAVAVRKEAEKALNEEAKKGESKPKDDKK